VHEEPLDASITGVLPCQPVVGRCYGQVRQKTRDGLIKQVRAVFLDVVQQLRCGSVVGLDGSEHFGDLNRIREQGAGGDSPGYCSATFGWCRCTGQCIEHLESRRTLHFGLVGLTDSLRTVPSIAVAVKSVAAPVLRSMTLASSDMAKGVLSERGVMNRYENHK